MSLINQMLRDLEQRNQGQSAAPVMQELPLAQVSDANRRHWPWLSVAMLLAIAYAWYERQQPISPQSAVPLVAVQAQIAAQQVLVAATLPPQASPQPSASQQAAIVTPTVTSKPTATTQTSPLPTPVPASTMPASTASVKNASKLSSPATSRRNASPANQVQTLLQQARGNVSLMMRKETLKEALQLDPDNLAVRDLLLQTLLKSGSGNEVETFLRDSLYRFPNHLFFITSQAQLQIQRKNFADAIATLEGVDSSEPAYLSLLAASYQQHKRHQDAAGLYQRLTQIQPDKAEYWLGLGVSCDNLHRRQDAVQAYRQALEKNTLNTDVVDYINQRLSVLN